MLSIHSVCLSVCVFQYRFVVFSVAVNRYLGFPGVIVKVGQSVYLLTFMVNFFMFLVQLPLDAFPDSN